MSDIVQKLWGFCHTLGHDGVDYGDYTTASSSVMATVARFLDDLRDIVELLEKEEGVEK